MLAVSVKMGDGRTVTLMPFAHVDVKRGAQVGEGDVLGTLAAEGDRSSVSAHVHMGLKKGGTYYDPMALFGLESGSSAAPATERAPGTAAAPAAAPARVPAAQEAASGAQGLQAPGAFREATAAAQEQYGTIESGVAGWQPQSAAVPNPLSELAAACSVQMSGLAAGLGAFAATCTVPVALLALGVLMAVGLRALATFQFERGIRLQQHRRAASRT